LQAKLPAGARGGEIGAPGGRSGADAATFLGNRFAQAETAGVVTEPDPQDLKEISAAIRTARRQADWVLVTIDSHQSMPGGRETPPEFLETVARAAIDAGADLFVGHGPHILKGIELYKGRPIFYSLANFIFQNETVEFVPAENYLPLGLGPDASPADFN